MRLAIAGLGGWGRNWSRLLIATDGYEIVDVVDPVNASREWAVANLNLDPAHTHASLDALTDSDAEAVLVLTPPDTHRAGAIAALEAGKHVLIEKPVSTSTADARAVIDAADRTGLIAMVSQNYRYSRPARQIRDMILDGRLGDVLSVRNLYRNDFRDHLAPGDFRWKMPDPLLLDMSVHHFDLLRAMTGQEPVTVDARSWKMGDIAFENPSSATALMDLDGQATYAYDGDWASHQEPIPWPGQWNIVGTKGQIRWDGEGRDGEPYALDLRLWDGTHEQTPVRADGVDSRLGSMAEFRRAITAGDQPETSARDNLMTLATVLTAITSTNRRAPVQLSEIVAN